MAGKLQLVFVEREDFKPGPTRAWGETGGQCSAAQKAQGMLHAELNEEKVGEEIEQEDKRQAENILAKEEQERQLARVL